MPSKTETQQSVTRQDFIRKFIDAGGGAVKYEHAAKMYDAMVEVFADAVVTGQKVTIGQVMSIKPVRKNARVVNMGFNGSNKTIYLGARLVFRCSVFKRFLDTHHLQWKL